MSLRHPVLEVNRVLYILIYTLYLYTHIAQEWKNRTLVGHERVDSLHFSIGR